MKKRFLIALCCVLSLCDQVLADGDNEIKRGMYRYMAFLYYPDESVVEPSGERFLRGAVLIKPEWLISSSFVPITINDIPLGFPRKTLLARLGAVTIDNKFLLSEDEEEQEREVIQIVRPYNQSATQWWRTDISLLKTLLPFNLTTTVSTGNLRVKPYINVTSCFILIYARRTGNWSEDKHLMQLFVNVLPPESQDCGSHYHEDTMLCAVDNEEDKSYMNNTGFCQGNSGGPLVCENEIAGIQTYVENNCTQPHLYQHLSAWNNFINCGIENKCTEEECSNVCSVINKDEEVSNSIKTNGDTVISVETTLTEQITMITVPSQTNEVVHYDELLVTSTTLLTTTAPQTTTEELTTTEEPITTTLTPPTTQTETMKERLEKTSWPKEKYPPRATLVEADGKNVERKANVEAQRQDVKVKAKKGAAQRNTCYFQSLFSIFIIACLI